MTATIKDQLFQSTHLFRGATDGYVDSTDNALKAEETTAMWSTPDSPMWSAPDSPMWVSQFKSFTATYSFTAPASGQFWMDLTVTGPLEISYSVNGGNAFPYSQKVMVKAGGRTPIGVRGLKFQ